MNSCDYYQDLISRFIDGEISHEEHDALMAHMKSCSRCSAMYAVFHDLSEILSEDTEPLPEGLHENIMAGIRRNEISKKNLRMRKLGLRTAISAAACAVLVIVAASGFNPAKRADSINLRSQEELQALVQQPVQTVSVFSSDSPDQSPAPMLPEPSSDIAARESSTVFFPTAVPSSPDSYYIPASDPYDRTHAQYTGPESPEWHAESAPSPDFSVAQANTQPETSAQGADPFLSAHSGSAWSTASEAMTPPEIASVPSAPSGDHASNNEAAAVSDYLPSASVAETAPLFSSSDQEVFAGSPDIVPEVQSPAPLMQSDALPLQNAVQDQDNSENAVQEEAVNTDSLSETGESISLQSSVAQSFDLSGSAFEDSVSEDLSVSLFASSSSRFGAESPDDSLNHAALDLSSDTVPILTDIPGPDNTYNQDAAFLYDESADSPADTAPAVVPAAESSVQTEDISIYGKDTRNKLLAMIGKTEALLPEGAELTRLLHISLIPEDDYGSIEKMDIYIYGDFVFCQYHPLGGNPVTYSAVCSLGELDSFFDDIRSAEASGSSVASPVPSPADLTYE